MLTKVSMWSNSKVCVGQVRPSYSAHHRRHNFPTDGPTHEISSTPLTIFGGGIPTVQSRYSISETFLFTRQK